MGFVEDERTFSTLTFMKMRLWNKHYEHLDLVVCMFAQLLYIIDSFPYNDVITIWTNEKVKGGLMASIVDSSMASLVLVLELSSRF
jgi:hypothetical protein